VKYLVIATAEVVVKARADLDDAKGAAAAQKQMNEAASGR